ncbi:MAG: nitrilase-related carbon-nitrogen hydrolase [Halofilum sp. (in: g-proteobacteria)]|nr:nitrilase-related carbon-nitrogen hydrolase [Halofilum sp. (in: g-proteobacteria)]
MAEPLPIAVYQYAARDEGPQERLGRLEAAAARAAAGGARLLVAPELFLSGYAIGDADLRARAEPADGPASARAGAIARAHGIALVYGYPESAGARTCNAARCIAPDGTPVANHRKVLRAGPGERARYAGGDGLTLFGLDGHTIAVLICYDVEMPEAVRAAALAGATLVAAPTALVDDHPFVARHMIPTRAFENGIYVAYANFAGEENGTRYLGESCIAGPDHRVPARAGAGEELLLATVDPTAIATARTTLPYLDDLVASPFAPRDHGRG